MNGPQPVSGAQAKRLAITVPVATAVLAFAANLSGNAPEVNMPRVLAGTVVLMVILALLAEGAPSIAAGFAWIILVTAFFVTGEPAWRSIANLTGGAGNGPTAGKGAGAALGAKAGTAARDQAGRAVAGAMQNIPTK